ncbi:MAG: protein kinase [Deltaproteobacteria bacterium]|nr:protein kinase [Deltaproteobacteria bacterium]MDQ3295895.1 serine/threonine protein kinase [Myxococcota bacterium]
MQVCLACSESTDESGRFCPACGAVLAAVDGRADTAVANEETSGRASAAASLLGTVIDGFKIEAVLGGGAFGTVYRGRQVGLDRVIAIKVPTHEIASDPVMAKRFAREARSAARIDHPGVITIYAVGELPDGRPYIAMQLFDGEPLHKCIEDGPLPPLRALEIARQIASALAETHAADVVHRDLKPTNIVWRRDRNGDDRVTLVDFGIAVCKPGTADATRLTAGGLIGTPHYMSPEQAHGDQVDARADLYALGCILYELVTGEPPFQGSGFEVLLAHLGRPVPRPSELNPDVPELVDDIVAHLTAKRPDDRVPSAEALVTLLDDAMDQLEGVKPMMPSEPRPKRAKRRSAAPRVDPDAVEDDGALRTSARTRHEKPSLDRLLDRPAYQPAHRVRYLLAGAMVSLVVCLTAFAALRLTSTSRAQDADPNGEIKRIELFRDDGETRLRVWVPEVMRADRTHRLRIELRNKLGAYLLADEVVVTIEDPSGKATGVIARPRNADPNQYGLPFLFKTAGTYKIRIFPPETTSTFLIDVAVVD